ncbi:MAG: GNAT family N-acetyltransferase [Nanoarchaeota archaeon]
MVYKIIKLKKKDLNALTEIEFQSQYINIKRKISKKQMKKYMLNRVTRGRELFFGYKEGGEIKGAIGFKPLSSDRHYCQIHWIAVKRKFQRQGIGRKLIKFIEKFAKKNNFKKICLYTGEDMHNIRRFYEKLGYKNTKRLPNFYKIGKNRTAILYSKML